MKVTLINTSDAGGGAPAACMRLLKALQLINADASLFVQHKKTADLNVYAVAKNWLTRLRAQFDFLYERLPFIWFHAKDKSVRFAFSTASSGTDISGEPLVTRADILHLHWTNQGFLSTVDLERLIKLKKPVVWTLHDMWIFTGGCHYAGTCDHFKKECGNCYFLRDAHPQDISHEGWIHKQVLLFGSKNVVFVTPSHWLADVARKSSLLGSFRIETIPNPIDTALFAPKDKTACRGKWGINTSKKIILFGAANINDRRKGIIYLVEALRILKEEQPASSQAEIVIFGKNKFFDTSLLPFKTHAFDVISSEEDLAELYSLADVFISPSVEDNLPNMIMESLACATPVVAFNTGGIPDMIVHRENGYLAEYLSSADLARGMQELLYTDQPAKYAEHARNKVLNDFTYEKVAAKYLALYQSIQN